MPSGYHPPIEEYLEAIYELREDGVEVIQARLVERLGHSAPTVSEMIKTLVDDGVVKKVGRSLSLSVEGEKLATSIVRKHRLAERLLVDILGIEWHLAHEEAGRWEHVISDRVATKIANLTSDPSTCPHGNQIPGTLPLPDDGRIRLTTLPLGSLGTIVRIAEGAESMEGSLQYLFENNLGVGATIELKEVGQSYLMVKNTSYTVKIENALGRFIWVTPNK